MIQQTSFDIHYSLLEKCMQLYNDGKISAMKPLTIRDVSEFNEAINSISNELGAGKIVIAYEPKSLFKVLILCPQARIVDNLN